MCVRNHIAFRPFTFQVRVRHPREPCQSPIWPDSSDNLAGEVLLGYPWGSISGIPSKMATCSCVESTKKGDCGLREQRSKDKTSSHSCRLARCVPILHEAQRGFISRPQMQLLSHHFNLGIVPWIPYGPEGILSFLSGHGVE